MAFFMELLLNLAWLLLALPACWLWRRSGNARARHTLGALQTVLALACVQVMLFPVISATDDLHAMRAEIEESPASKRSIRQASNDKASVWNSRLQSPPAVQGSPMVFAPRAERAGLALSRDASLRTRPLILRAGRAPPDSFVG